MVVSIKHYTHSINLEVIYVFVHVKVSTLHYVSFNYMYMQFISQFFTLQLVQISPFVKVLPLQNFPMYGILFHTCIRNNIF